nr:hypothetical protein [uncultured Psychroserpens sp.]
MRKFVPEIIESVSIKVSIYCLLINKKNLYNEFYKKNCDKKEYLNQFGQIQNILMTLGNNEGDKIPTTKFKQLKRNKGDKIVDYEIRTRDFRIYLFKDEEYGKIIVLGGFKKNQSKDINKLRRIKAEYFNQKKQ